MNEPNPDEDLDALFARQRTADHKYAPSFHAVSARLRAAEPPTPVAWPIFWRWAMPGAAAAVVALAAVFSFHQPAKKPGVAREAVVRELDRIDAAIQKSLAAPEPFTAWQSPTDFLLNPNQTPHIP